jgi:general secretion pathway protein G
MRAYRHSALLRHPGLRRDDEEGFTLVELMVVLVIIGLLATIVIINVMPAAEHAKVTTAQTSVRTLEQAVDMYYLDNRRYPTSQEGLQALLAGRYLRRLENDPWGHPFRYKSPGDNRRPYQISSLGADGREGGTGDDADITN